VGSTDRGEIFEQTLYSSFTDITRHVQIVQAVPVVQTVFRIVRRFERFERLERFESAAAQSCCRESPNVAPGFFCARQVGSAPGMLTRINQQYSIAENKGKRTVHIGFSRDVLGSGVKVQASSNLVGRAGI
jgi:hypothetical protein